MTRAGLLGAAVLLAAIVAAGAILVWPLPADPITHTVLIRHTYRMDYYVRTK